MVKQCADCHSIITDVMYAGKYVFYVKHGVCIKAKWICSTCYHLFEDLQW